MLLPLALPLSKGAGSASPFALAVSRSPRFHPPHTPSPAAAQPRIAPSTAIICHPQHQRRRTTPAPQAVTSRQGSRLPTALVSLSGTPLQLPSHVRTPSGCTSPSTSASPSPGVPLSDPRCTGPLAMFSSSTKRVQPGPGQESVWDYPRPPRLEKVSKRIEIVFNGAKIADSTQAYRVLETSHPPVYYIPQSDIQMQHVRKSPGGSSFCEWKGSATYWSVGVGGKTAENVGWSYESPTAPFRPIKSHIAFYCAPMDECRVGGEKAEPQPGGFYGGWVTKDIVGPFKGAQGTWGW